MSSYIWGAVNFPPTAADLAAAKAAGCSEIVQLPNGTLIAGVNTIPDPSPVPQQVTGIQLRMAVLASPQAAAVAEFVAAASVGVQMAYNSTPVFDRGDVLLAAIVTVGVLTSAEVDAIFTAAAAIVD
jgi:hypothetical protein